MENALTQFGLVVFFDHVIDGLDQHDSRLVLKLLLGVFPAVYLEDGFSISKFVADFPGVPGLDFASTKERLT